jgi:hypothetical protein
MPPDLRFCFFDTNGNTSLPSCTPIPPAGVTVPRVASTGSGYAVFLMNGDVAHAWLFDDAGAPTSDSDIWSSEPDDLYFVAAAHTTGWVLAVASGVHAAGSCPTNRGHTIDESLSAMSHTSLDWLPVDFRPQYGPAIAGAGGRLGAVYTGKCILGGLSPCDGLPGDEPSVTFLTTMQNGIPLVTHAAVPVPRAGLQATWDGDRFVVGYMRMVSGAPDIRLSAFEAKGALVMNNVLLPLDYADGGNELLGFHGIVSVGAFDYLVVYVMNTASGPRTRLARVTLAPI